MASGDATKFCRNVHALGSKYFNNTVFWSIKIFSQLWPTFILVPRSMNMFSYRVVMSTGDLSLTTKFDNCLFTLVYKLFKQEWFLITETRIRQLPTVFHFSSSGSCKSNLFIFFLCIAKVLKFLKLQWLWFKLILQHVKHLFSRYF